MKKSIKSAVLISALVQIITSSAASASGWVCNYKNPDILMSYQRVGDQWMLHTDKLESLENEFFLILQYKSAYQNYGSVISTVINKKTLKSTYTQISFFEDFGEDVHSDKGECRFID